MSEIPLEEAPGQVTDAAHDAARGQVVYLTEHGERLAAIVPAELAAELESLTPQQFRELLEDFADAQAARESLAEIEAGAEPVPAEQVWAELGLGRDVPPVRAGVRPESPAGAAKARPARSRTHQGRDGIAARRSEARGREDAHRNARSSADQGRR